MPGCGAAAAALVLSIAVNVAMNTIFLGIGSNLNRDNALRFAVAQLRKILLDMQVSSVWESHAVRQAEPDYYNMVIKAVTRLSLEDLFAAVHRIEELAGRELMYHQGTNFGIRRRLDIDILLFGDTITTVPCKVPRHDIVDYPFVICPLLELEPELVRPGDGVRIADCWEQLRTAQQGRPFTDVRRVAFDFSQEPPAWHGDE